MNTYKVKLPNGKAVEARNKVLLINKDTVIFDTNKGPYTMSTKDYCRYGIFANKVTVDHDNPQKAVAAINTGYEHLSVPALVMGAEDDQRVGYRNNNHMDGRRDNLYIK